MLGVDGEGLERRALVCAELLRPLPLPVFLPPSLALVRRSSLSPSSKHLISPLSALPLSRMKLRAFLVVVVALLLLVVVLHVGESCRDSPEILPAWLMAGGGALTSRNSFRALLTFAGH